MLTISNPRPAAAAVEYFRNELAGDGPAAAAAGVWRGRAATALGLEGPVGERDLARVLDGRCPATGRDLLAQRRAQRTGAWDLTFAAPKSVSLVALVGGDQRLVEAHRNAVDHAMALLEDYVRGRDGAFNADGERTGEMAAAQFTHIVSRELEPHLHTHCLVANLTRTSRGWRALHDRTLFRMRRLATKAYRASLANQLTMLGYRITLGRGERAVEIDGISREQIERFATRNRQIVENRARLGGYTHERDRLAHLGTRVRKRDVEAADLVRWWQETAASVSLDAEAIVRASASDDRSPPRLQARGGVEGARLRSGVIEETVDDAVKSVLERESATTEQELVSRALDAHFGRFFPQEISSSIARLRAAGEIIDLAAVDHRTGRPRPTGRITSAATVALESDLVRWMREGQGLHEPLAAGADTGPRPGVAGDEFELKAGEQEAAVRMVLESTDWLVGLQGYAGVGKTFAVRRVIRAAFEAGYVVDCLAPYTGHVAALHEEGVANACTVSKYLSTKPQARSRDLARVIIIDEAGTLDTAAMHQVLTRARELNARVVLLGDEAQHKAVAAGSPFRLLREANMRMEVLKDIQRQKTDELRWAVEDAAAGRMRDAVVRLKGIAHAEAVRDEAGRLLDSEGEAFDPLVDQHGRRVRGPEGRPLALAPFTDAAGVRIGSRRGAVVEVRDEGARNGAVAHEYCKWLDDPRRVLCVAASNREREAINKAVREKMRELGKLTGEDRLVKVLRNSGCAKSDRKLAINYEPGQVVFFTNGSKRFRIGPLSFADVVRVDVRTNEVTVRLRSGRETTYNPRELYGVTIYDVETRQFAVGDRIQYRAPDDSSAERIPNGALGRITAIDANGRATIELDAAVNGAGTGTLDLTRPVQIDHGYCVTSHSSQGKTVDRVFISIDATRGSSRLVNQELGYVAASRARFEAVVFTDDEKRLEAAIERANPKYNAADFERIPTDEFVDAFTPLRAADRSDHVSSRSEHVGSDHDRSDHDRSDHAGSDHAGSEHVESEPAKGRGRDDEKYFLMR